MTSSTKFPNLFTPYQIENVTIRNRIVQAPIGQSLWGANGEVSDRMIDYYVARARGGTGLLTICFVPVDYPPGVGYQILGNLSTQDFVPGHYRLVEKLHAYGAKVSLQIHQLGRSGFPRPGKQLISASSIPCNRLEELLYPEPRPMEINEIHEIKEYYGAIAQRAKVAGYDMVEVHGAHGYLVSSFMSKFLNNRTDEYGGSLENRMRFPVELIRRMREMTDFNFPIGIRITADELLGDKGVTVKESPIMAKMLEEAGAAFISVSSALYENLHKSNDIMRFDEGWKEYIWEAVHSAVSVPTFAAGGIRSPELCEKVISEGKTDFVALGRQLLCDPDWPNKAKEDRPEDIRKCTSCMECLGIITGRAQDTRCSINVELGREKDFEDMKPADTVKKVMVVGGGPAGMEAARIAALRGHDVTVYDKNNEIGGQLLLAATPPGKSKLLWFRDYEKRQLGKLGVKFQLGTEVTKDTVVKNKADVVIVATGSRPNIPQVPGVTNNNVTTAFDLLEGKQSIKDKNVVIVGGGLVGVETAEYLAHAGNKVTVIEMLPAIASDMEPLNRKGLMEELKTMPVEMLVGQELCEIKDKSVVALNKQTGEKKSFDADYVILACGVHPENTLAGSLADSVDTLYAVGDCVKPRNILSATYEGAFTALHI